MAAGDHKHGSMEFVVPDEVDFDDVAAELNSIFDLEWSPAVSLRQVYYDSFDWRVFRAGMSLCHETSRAGQSLTCHTLNRSLIAEAVVKEVPRFAQSLPPGPLRTRLMEALGIRALLKVASLTCTRRVLVLRNTDEKIVTRLEHDRFSLRSSKDQGSAPRDRLTVIPLRGFERQARKVCASLQAAGLEPPTRSLMESAVASHGREVADYSSKLVIHLDAGTTAIDAMSAILARLHDTMCRNEPGIRGDWDTEFLHDFRVAVRRTRSALGQIKGVFDEQQLARFKSDFAWLGAVTGPKRDLDVHVLDFHKGVVGLALATEDSLGPLLQYLEKQKIRAGRELIAALGSKRYRALMRDWPRFLKHARDGEGAGPAARQTVLEVANRRIWRLYRRVVQEGRAIDSSSPDEDLHELRKTCKKLRYLMEFFASLYPRRRIRALIGQLKRFQENLGDFQDQSVQGEYLRQLADELTDEGVPADTLLAIGAMIEKLAEDRVRTRAEFAERFDDFQRADNRRLFRALFKEPART